MPATNDSFETYCPQCGAMVKAHILQRAEIETIQGEPVEYVSDIAICPNCGTVIDDARLETANLHKACQARRSA